MPGTWKLQKGTFVGYVTTFLQLQRGLRCQFLERPICQGPGHGNRSVHRLAQACSPLLEQYHLAIDESAQREQQYGW